MVNQVPGAKFRASGLPAGRQLVMFVADWCGYCHRFMTHYKRIHEAWAVDITDEDDPLWEIHDVHVVPTVILFVDGVEARRWAGVLSAHHADQMAEALHAGPAVAADASAHPSG